MTNETLLQQLDHLREEYLQQQKTASGLKAALKSLADAHNRTQKVLTDYRGHNSGVDVTSLHTILTDLRLKETAIDPLAPDLRRQLKALTGISAALKDAATALRADPVDVVKLDKALSVLQAAPPQDIAALLPELNAEMDIAQRTLGDQFGEKLRDALAEQGVRIGGRAPRFEIGRFELAANFAKRALVIRYGHDLVNPRVPIAVEATLKAYHEAAKQVTGRGQDGNVWMEQFYEAYQSARRKRVVEGTRCNIVDCYVELVLLRQGRAFASEPSKRTFTDYTRAQFIYDFYQFTNEQRKSHHGQFVRAHSATKSQTDNSAKCMWVVEGAAPSEGRYIGDIEFMKD